MKSLLIIRHAKSSWDHILQSDFDRPLNERGKMDAPMMALRLIKRNIAIDRFISSPARRAKKTASLFINEYGKPETDIRFVDELYHAPAHTFIKIVSGLDDGLATVAIFSHNPGITEYVNMLTGTQIDNMPTAGIFAVKAPISSWVEFAAAKKEFWFFDYPKSDIGL